MDVSIIDRYRKIQNTYGSTSKKESTISSLKRQIAARFKETPDFEEKTKINDIIQQLLVIHSRQDIFEKKIIAFPDETFVSGGIVDCYGAKWLITEVDANKQIYTVGKMVQCSLLLKWQNASGKIIERWAVVENSVSPNGMDEGSVITTPDMSLRLKLPLDNETIQLHRDKRFLADISGITGNPDAYTLTQRNVLSDSYGSGGIVILGITQGSFNNETDNVGLGIADYFIPEPTVNTTGIMYSNEPIIKIGGSFKRFTAIFKDGNGNVLAGLTPIWTWTSLSSQADKFVTKASGNYFDIKAMCAPELVGTSIRLKVKDSHNYYQAELLVGVGDL